MGRGNLGNTRTSSARAGSEHRSPSLTHHYPTGKRPSVLSAMQLWALSHSIANLFAWGEAAGDGNGSARP
jgi:hypothetical protein